MAKNVFLSSETRMIPKLPKDRWLNLGLILDDYRGMLVVLKIDYLHAHLEGLAAVSEHVSTW